MKTVRPRTTVTPEDMEVLRELTGTSKDADAIRSAIIYFLVQHGKESTSQNIQHGGHKPSPKDGSK